MNHSDARARFLSDPEILSALRRCVAAMVPSREVDDIVGAALVNAVEAKEYPPERPGFISWLLTIGADRAIDWLRSHTRRAPHQADVGGDVDALPGGCTIDKIEARDHLRAVERHL